MHNVTFHELDKNCDLRAYHDLARNRMNGIDMVTGDAMTILLTHRLARLWEARDEGEPVGYCSILIQSPDNPGRSVHFLNMFVLAGHERRGYGDEMMRFRITQFGNLPLVVAIRPDNAAMNGLAAKWGFCPGFAREPWVVWHRPADDGKDVLIRAHADDHLARGMRQDLVKAGYRADIQFGDQRFRDPVTRAKWPDEAAFSAIITRHEPLDIR